MKKEFVLMIILLTCISTISVFAGDLAFTVSIDWQMSVQGGIEYRFTDHFGMKADLGISVAGLLTSDLFAAVYVTEPDNPWQIKILAGIPNMNVVLTFEGAMVSFGGAMEVGRAINERMALDFRIGAGFPLFFDEGDMIREIDFPFNPWPEAALSLRF